MAERKPLFMSAAGYSEEMATSDSMTLGALAMGGNITMNSNKITGLAAGTADGDAVAYGQTADFNGLSSDGNIALSGGATVTGVPTPTTGTDAANKTYVDNAVSGIGWVGPVAVRSLYGNDTVANLNGLSPAAGDAWVVTDSGTLTAGSLAVTAGDLVEYSGSAWVLIADAVGGFVPAGTRAILAEGTIQSPYTNATDNDKIVEFSGSSNTGTDTGDTADSTSVLIEDSGHVGYWDNVAFVYEGTVPSGQWVQWSGAGSIVAGDGLAFSGNTLNVGAGNGITVAADTVSVDPDTETGGNIQAANITANGVGVDISAIAGTGLEADGSANLRIAASAAGDGLTGGGGSALAVNLEASNPSLQISTDELGLKIYAAGGLQKDANGVSVKLDDTPDTLDVDADGLKVVGLPSLFKINDVAVGATVTAANLDTLTDGSNADALHTHSSVLATEAPKVEDDLTVNEAVAAGDPVFWSTTNDRVEKATAALDAESRVIGLARTAQATPGSTAPVVSMGLATGVLVGATAGTPYYLQAAGGIGTSLPGAGNRVILLGYAKNATDLFVMIHDYGKKAA